MGVLEAKRKGCKNIAAGVPNPIEVRMHLSGVQLAPSLHIEDLEAHREDSSMEDIKRTEPALIGIIPPKSNQIRLKISKKIN